jgi:hypothetical protein
MTCFNFLNLVRNHALKLLQKTISSPILVWLQTFFMSATWDFFNKNVLSSKIFYL